MTVTNVEKNKDNLTMTITAEFDAPVERVWQLWENPRLLERWWGPPTYPATFTDFNMNPGGSVGYYMTGPEGERHGGWWRFVKISAPHSLEFEDGFSDDKGIPNPKMPSTVTRVALTGKTAGGTRMTIASTWSSLQDMEQMIAMGMEEGMAAAMGQMDALLA